ncbi:Cytochrome c1 heme lyase, partial [Ascosphaera atra]
MGAGASTPSTQPPPAQQPAASSPPASCPVDHKAREVWLSQHRDAAKAGDTESTDKSPPPNLKTRPLSSDREISSIPRAFPQPSDSTQDASTPASACPVPHGASHAAPLSNNESETGQDKATGRWIYPSEKQFFEALLRKNTPNSASSPKDLATSVASIIPIHNAVNERAWSEILTWESRAPMSDPGSAKCGGPKLYSFRGLGVESQFLSPRARLNSLL